MQSDAYLSDNAAWAARCHFWRAERQHLTGAGLPASKPRPLILSGFGVSFRIEGDTLRIKDGFTHYPQKVAAYRFFKGDRDIPNRIILLDCKGCLSFDVMTWLLDHGITLIKLDWQGRVVCLTSPQGYAANRFKVDWQRDTRADAAKRMAFCNHLIVGKVEQSILTLEKAIRRSKAWEPAMEVAYATLTRLEERPAKSVEELRGIEGTAAAAYFRALAEQPMIWGRQSRKPIPQEWRRVGTRSSGLYGSGNRHARHPSNAILNYAYTVLESQVRMSLVADGYDPGLGIMHESRADASALVLDMMEFNRADVDREVLGFIKQTQFEAGDFTVRSDGVVRLNPELARAVARLMVAGALRSPPIQTAPIIGDF